MALSNRERQCIEALCTYLGSQRGDKWRITDDSLDARHPNERSPEAMISDGAHTVAVEVKTLPGPKVWNQFRAYILSLRQALVPSRSGYYELYPPIGYEPPWPRSFIRTVRAGIEKACHAVEADGEGYVRVPRRSLLLKENSTIDLVRCSHGTDPVPGISRLVQGHCSLPDGGGQHSFYTDRAKEDFRDSIIAGIGRIESGESDVWIEWEEEWLLRWSNSAETAVEVVAVSRAFSVEAAVAETVGIMIDAANDKFHRRWADRHAAILDRRFIFADEHRVRMVFADITPEDYASIDHVYLFDTDSIRPIFSRS